MASSFFDEKDTEPSGSFFDSNDLHTEAPAPEIKPEISKSRSALIGAGQGATLGFGEELTAPFAAGAAMMSGVPDLPLEEPGVLGRTEKLIRLMEDYRKLARGEQKEAQDQNPMSYMGGAVAGSLLLPGMGGANLGKAVAPTIGTTAAKIAGGATEGAITGGLMGAGEAEGGFENMDQVKNRATGVAQMGAAGAMGGAAIPGAMAVLKGAGKVGGVINKAPFIGDTTEAFVRGAEGQSLITKAGRQEAQGIIRNEFAAPLYNDLKTLTHDVGKQIGAKIDEASAAGTKVNLTDEINQTLAALKEIKTNSGSIESKAHAAAADSEIKSLLGIKDQDKITNELANGPEGLISSTEEILPSTYEVDPNVAQQLKHALKKYSPVAEMDPLLVDSAKVADNLRAGVRNKLNEATGVNDSSELINEVTGEITEGPSLNKQYSDLKTVSKQRLKINPKDTPNNIRDKLTTLLAATENENISGGNKLEILKDTVEALKQVDPAIAAEYEGPLTDAIRRHDLAQHTGGGVGVRLMGVPSAFIKSGANLAGLGVNKIPGVKAAASLVPKVLDAAQSPIVSKSIATAAVSSDEASGINNKRNAQLKPYEINRQYAKTTEAATPEALTAQANDLRAQHGEKANQLASILENMAQAKPDTRRALMFTILQNPAHRKMLGLNQENE